MSQSLANPIARKNDGRIEVNDAPVRVKWRFDDLVTSDGHRLTLAFACTLRALTEPAEKKLFEETFLSGSVSAGVDDITNHFDPALCAAAASLVNRQTAETAMSDAFQPQWIDAVRTAGNAIAFSCGVELLAPFSVEVTSPTLHQERLEQMQRTVAERKAADRVGHFQRAAELLKQWDALKASAPSVSPGQMLEQLNPADRGAMLETLIMASAQQAAQPDLWAVAGSSLVQIDLTSPNMRPRIIQLPTSAGMLRSVTVMDDRVLIGARNGIIVIDPKQPENGDVYTDPGLTSEHGFSRATIANGGLWACHREGGVVGWRLGEFDRPACTVRPAELGGSPKLLSSSNAGQTSNQLMFAIEQRLSVAKAAFAGCGASTLATLPAPIVGLVALEDRIIAAAEDGSIVVFDRLGQRVSDIRAVGRLSGAASLPWLGSARLLLATPDGPIYCVGIEDQLTTAFTGPYIGFRSVVGSAGKVAAMSSDRQRVILWNTWDGRKPAGEIHLTSLTRHRVADIGFGC